ncbi:TPA: hypothetical protein DIV48_03560 [Candidatus Kaiserbacteria bacterium]|nr:MAG: hypothetical protein UY93_C0002G0329 [Parcubacteria group bacterium GW2011_GWA1_56_13]KKW46239.1 MAG: hypothetical protein UY97_C0008G0026 [Parcubacteria group bacterium GW2011_GWB1_57_6]HCR52689.1 hypothetical protein [Candidatus Kaiserbacteria bacterium]
MTKSHRAATERERRCTEASRPNVPFEIVSDSEEFYEKINSKNLKSLINLKKEVQETYLLIHALEAQIGATEQLLDFTKAKTHPGYGQFKKYLEINDNQMVKLYELGFIALFANFECFMFEILKELFKKYPSSFQSERVLKFEDVKDFKKVLEVKNYFIDSIAIEKSQDIDTWATFLTQRFGIKIFKTKKDLERLKLLNALRNITLHSGGKTNSRFSKQVGGILKSKVPIGETHKLDMKKFFVRLYAELNNLVQNTERI